MNNILNFVAKVNGGEAVWVRYTRITRVVPRGSVKEFPEITRERLASEVGLPIRGVEKNLAQLKSAGKIRRIGGRKGAAGRLWKAKGICSPVASKLERRAQNAEESINDFRKRPKII